MKTLELPKTRQKSDIALTYKIIVNFALQILSKMAIFEEWNILYKYTGEYYKGYFYGRSKSSI